MKIYPYETLPDDIWLHIERAVLLPSEAAAFLDENERTIWFADADTSRHPRLHLEAYVTGPQSEIEQYQEACGEISGVLTAHCRGTNLRQSIPLRLSEGSSCEWHTEIELDRRSLRGLVTLRAILTGAQNGRPHRFLGGTQEWRILNDEALAPQITGRPVVEFVWRSFKARDAELELQQAADQPYYLNLLGEKPIVYLNASFPGLREIFPPEGKPSGAWLPLHEALSVGICRSVWQALFQAALDAVREGESDEAPLPPGWQRTVLHFLLPKLYPGREVIEAQCQALRDQNTGGTTFLQTRLLDVINTSLVQEGRALRRAIDGIMQLGEVLEGAEK